MSYTLTVKITNFYPKNFCMQCMFCRVDDYGDSFCMLNGLKHIRLPEYDRPEWCPFNDAKEETT